MAMPGMRRGSLGFVRVVAVLTMVSACATARDVASDGAEAPTDDADPALEAEGTAPVDDVGAVDRSEGDDLDPVDRRPPLGSKVTVTGRVDEVVDENAFEIVQRGGSLEFLVLVRRPNVDVDDVVRITGTVREQDFDALAAELKFPLDENLYSPADPQQVIVAESVEVL